MAATATESQKPVGGSSEPCPLQKCSILVQVLREDTKQSMAGIMAKLEGPTPGSGQTDSGNGTKLFQTVNPGTYKVEVALTGKDAEAFEVPKTPAFTVGR